MDITVTASVLMQKTMTMMMMPSMVEMEKEQKL